MILFRNLVPAAPARFSIALRLPWSRPRTRRSRRPVFSFLARRPEVHDRGTVHAAALLAVAEAGSGVFLLDAFRGMQTGSSGGVWRVETKYRFPATGQVFTAQGRLCLADDVERWKVELASRGRLWRR